jgi:hypothetical protein
VIRATFAATLLVAATQAVFAADPAVSTTGVVPIPFCNTAYPECQDWQQFAAAANSSSLSTAGTRPSPAIPDQSSLRAGWVARCARFRESVAHETAQQATQECTAQFNKWLAANQQ